MHLNNKDTAIIISLLGIFGTIIFFFFNLGTRLGNMEGSLENVEEICKNNITQAEAAIFYEKIESEIAILFKNDDRFESKYQDLSKKCYEQYNNYAPVSRSANGTNSVTNGITISKIK